jgi:hypothetical protein
MNGYFGKRLPMAATKPARPFLTGDGRRFETLAQATTHAGNVYRRTGNIIAVVKR